jgi:hypothetical protein
MRTREEVEAANAAVVKERAGRPGFDARMGVFIVARDPTRGLILLGGLGALGVGTMWVDEQPKHKGYAGYDLAPVRP